MLRLFFASDVVLIKCSTHTVSRSLCSGCQLLRYPKFSVVPARPVSQFVTSITNLFKSPSSGVIAPSEAAKHLPPSPPPPSSVENDYFAPPADLALPDVQELNALGEPTLQSLGLGCWHTPSGLIQQMLEAIHVQFHLPWIGAIFLSAFVVRFCLIPLQISTRRTLPGKMKHAQIMKFLNDKLHSAYKKNDLLETYRVSQQMSDYLRANDRPLQATFWSHLSDLPVSPLMLLQVPFFLSFIHGLRGMIYLPVPGFKTGGLGFLHITDLTIPDPYYILPISVGALLYFNMQSGADGIMIKQRVLLIGLGLATTFFISVAPAGVQCYMASAFAVASLSQLLIRLGVFKITIKMPIVRETLEAEMNNSMRDFDIFSGGVFGIRSKFNKLVKEERQKMVEKRTASETDKEFVMRSQQEAMIPLKNVRDIDERNTAPAAGDDLKRKLRPSWAKKRNEEVQAVPRFFKRLWSRI